MVIPHAYDMPFIWKRLYGKHPRSVRSFNRKQIKKRSKKGFQATYACHLDVIRGQLMDGPENFPSLLQHISLSPFELYTAVSIYQSMNDKDSVREVCSCLVTLIFWSESIIILNKDINKSLMIIM